MSLTGSAADPEVVDRPLRRRFSPSYKLRIVEEADRCTEPGEVGQVLRREGLYSSHLTTWRKAAHSGSLKALSKKNAAAGIILQWLSGSGGESFVSFMYSHSSRLRGFMRIRCSNELLGGCIDLREVLVSGGARGLRCFLRHG